MCRARLWNVAGNGSQSVSGLDTARGRSSVLGASLGFRGKPYRVWLQYLDAWAAGAELAAEPHAPAVVQRLGGAARDLARAAPTTELGDGRTDPTAGVIESGPTLLARGLARWFGQCAIETSTRCIVDLLGSGASARRASVRHSRVSKRCGHRCVRRLRVSSYPCLCCAGSSWRPCAFPDAPGRSSSGRGRAECQRRRLNAGSVGFHLPPGPRGGVSAGWVSQVLLAESPLHRKPILL